MKKSESSDSGITALQELQRHIKNGQLTPLKSSKSVAYYTRMFDKEFEDELKKKGAGEGMFFAVQGAAFILTLLILWFASQIFM